MRRPEGLISDWPTARYLATNLTDAFAVSSDDTAEFAADRLNDTFDQAPVRDATGTWVGFVRVQDLGNAPGLLVRDVMRPVESAVAAAESPMA